MRCEPRDSIIPACDILLRRAGRGAAEARSFGRDRGGARAALKQVPACEYNPFEAIQTNIMAGECDRCGDRSGSAAHSRAQHDKAVNPINLYGATKLCAEKCCTGQRLCGRAQYALQLRALCNVVGSRGSVIPVFLEQKRRGRSRSPIRA